jgi:hypothetical protein
MLTTAPTQVVNINARFVPNPDGGDTPRKPLSSLVSIREFVAFSSAGCRNMKGELITGKVKCDLGYTKNRYTKSGIALPKKEEGLATRWVRVNDM